jgi:hypothetical protein
MPKEINVIQPCLYKEAYHWTTRDKWKYAISLIPFLIAFFGTAYLLGTISVYLSLIFLGLYLIGNVFQAGACTGCPYRGKYCPPIFGVYPGNFLSMVLYKNKRFDIKFVRTHAKIAEFVIYGAFLFPVYWLFTLSWYFPVVYFVLLLLHLALFMPTQCEKCSYNDICPGGIAWGKFRVMLRNQKPFA